MKSKIFILTFLMLYCIRSVSQIISPDVNTILCPSQTYSFTVTLPLASPYTQYLPSLQVNGWNVSINVGGNITNALSGTVVTPINHVIYPTANTVNFQFQGSFQDDNTPQNFRVTSIQNGVTSNYDFTFLKIESFKIPVSGTNSKPSPSLQLPLSVPLCVTNPINISFQNVLFYAYDPAHNYPSYGSSTQYEYLLPSGWKLGTVVSNGTDWLPSGNNVTITPHAYIGDGSYIQIRAISPCNGPLLIKGVATAIPIVRPAPVLAITTPTGINELCSGSKTFNITGVPPGSTISWSTSNAPAASIPPNSSGTSVVVTKGAVNGQSNLKATVTTCSGVYNAQVTILAGGPLAANQSISTYSNMTYCQNNVFVILPSSGFYPFSGTLQLTDAQGLSTKYIYSDQGLSNPHTMVFDNTFTNGTVIVSSNRNDGYLALRCTMSNTCGSANKIWTFVSSNCNAIQSSGIPSEYGSSTTDTLGLSISESISRSNIATIFPNPTRNNLTVSIPGNLSIQNIKIGVKDLSGKELKRINASGYSTSFSIAEFANGIYILEIYEGGKTIFIKKIVKN